MWQVKELKSGPTPTTTITIQEESRDAIPQGRQSLKAVVQFRDARSRNSISGQEAAPVRRDLAPFGAVESSRGWKSQRTHPDQPDQGKS